MGCHFTKPNSSRVSLLTFSVSVCFFPFLLVKRTTLCTSMVCAALCPFGGLVVPCMSCPAGLVGIVLVLCSCWCVSLSSWFCCAPRCAWVGPVASFVVCPLLLWFLSLSSLLSLPRGLSCLVLWSSFVPWFAGTSLWVSGCSCDGLVALLSCWECG